MEYGKIALRNILVVGASGQLGKALGQSVRNDNNIQVLGTSFQRTKNGLVFVDITTDDSVEDVFDLFRPSVVILSSSLTSVDFCERSPHDADKINTAGVKIVKDLCDEYGASLVFLSSDYVFDGTSGPNRETDPVNPINVYGRTKLAGEKIASSAQHGSLIIRTNTLYSYDEESLNFAMQIIDSHKAGRQMRVPVDQYATPTYAPDLAAIIIELVSRNIRGLYHVCGPDVLSRYEFALKICSCLGFGTDFITPVLTPELKQLAPRPLKAGLLADKLIIETGLRPASVEQGLADLKRVWTLVRKA